MSYFQPAIPLSGYAGWRLLEKTSAKQMETFEKSPSLQRNIEYFRENISKATSAEALVKDRRLLSVALGAFGLGDEIGKKAFVQKVLEGGTEDSSSLANKLSDARYKAFAKAFSYGDSTSVDLTDSNFVEDIIARYKSREFESAVGEVDDDMRIAMNFKREIAGIASSNYADRSGWYQVLGQAPVLELVRTAFGLPSSVSNLDVDKQKEIFEQKAQDLYGDKTVAAFLDSGNVEDMTRRFFLHRQIEKGPTASTPGMAALTLLQNTALGGSSLTNLLLSQG